MTRYSLIVIFIASLILNFSLAGFQSSPGYMDADYHLYVGQRIAEGKGFTENILWNYLDEPDSLPHPSNLYWPPLPSILTALGIYLLPNSELFVAGRFFFILAASLLPVITTSITFQLSGNRKTAGLAGIFALLSPFYMPYNLTTDSFSITMLLGGLFFLQITRAQKKGWANSSLMAFGAIAGFLYLARAEGMLWLLMAIFAVVRINGSRTAPRPSLRMQILVFLLPFLLITLPWALRNFTSFGTLFAPGGLRSLWLANYDELFAYPASQLMISSWLRSGWRAIFQARFWALGQNLVTFIVVQGAILLAPLILLAAWKMRKNVSLQIAALSWLLLLAGMSFLFPFPGVRGGFFHAAAAIQPFMWSLAAIGFFHALNWAIELRGWPPNQATAILQWGTLIIVAGLSLTIFRTRVIGPDPADPIWNQSARHYEELAALTSNLGLTDNDIVMVNNPPGFSFASRLPAIVIPDGSSKIVLDAAQYFGADYLILENNHPAGLKALYISPDSVEAFEMLATFDGTYIFRIKVD